MTTIEAIEQPKEDVLIAIEAGEPNEISWQKVAQTLRDMADEFEGQR